MKYSVTFSSVLVVLFFFVVAPLCHAETIVPREIIPRGQIQKDHKKDLPPATPEQVDEALDVSQVCRTYEHYENYYDCDCMGMKFLELRRKNGDGVERHVLENQVRKMCPNTAGAAGLIYQRCLAWAPKEVGLNYESFCHCYGKEYSALYAKNPTDNQNIREAQLTSSLTKCGLGDISQQDAAHSDWLDKLRAMGLYKKLFPGADKSPPKKENNVPSNPAPAQ